MLSKVAYELFTDCWKLYKKYCDSSLDDKQCMEFVAEAESLRKKYDDNEFSNALLLATISEIDRIATIKK